MLSAAEQPTAPAPHPPLANDADGWRPEQIGPYAIRSVLGEGGFGIVYLAEQSHPVRRLVALKVIKPGMDSRAVIARFEAERQALAMMSHPGVAQVFDGGVILPSEAGAGRPYFVMEYVDGASITAFCDERRLTINERVSLFVQVCEAVQHAHAKGVIHRDLKPRNILVAEVGGKPLVKVIDFGVAKALDHDGEAVTVFTDHGQVVGTAEYMSPEQADPNAGGVDTRSDVYALGVVLYELLTGVRPFDLARASVPEVQRLLRDVTPPKPSTRLETMIGSDPSAETASRVADARRVEARSLSRRLRADLDWVVMKCLEKDRERRYPGPGSLGRDLRRYLAGEAVEAGPPAVAYRLSKFTRRHRASLAWAGGAALAIVAGAAVGGAGLANAAAERERADETIREFIARQEAIDPIADTPAAADIDATDGLASSADQLLRAAQSAYERSDYPLAAELADRSRTIYRSRFGADDPRSLAAQYLVGSSLLQNAGTADQAATLLSDGLDRAIRSAAPEELIDRYAIMRLMAMRRADRVDQTLAEAPPLITRLIDRYGDTNRHVLTTQLVLANAMLSAGDTTGAIEFAQSVRDRSSQLAPDHETRLNALNTLGRALSESDRADQAPPVLKELADATALRYGTNHRRTLTAQRNLAKAYIASGNAAAAIPVAESALRIGAALGVPDEALRLESATALVAAGRMVEGLDVIEGVIRGGPLDDAERAERLAPRLDALREAASGDAKINAAVDRLAATWAASGE